MSEHDKDATTMDHIQHLVAEEHRLFEQHTRSADDDRRLAAIQVKLDQCWDLLRQRRAKRETGGDPADAHVRPPGVVEKYIG